MKALKNLPKTLEETYDRIFATIPKEERIFVHLVLRWISHHNEILNGDGISCDVLIQAVTTSAAELTGEQNVRYYDKDTLQEICGCLIDISLKDNYAEIECPQYSAVTFAHYTVREYLDSGRISNSAVTECSAVEGSWTELFIKITLSEAQNFEQTGLLGVASSRERFDDSDVVGAINSNFTDYCVTFGIPSLYQWPELICSRDILRKLVIDLVDPSKPHFETLIMAAMQLEFSGSLDTSCWDALLLHDEWHMETSTEVKHLCNLLFLYENHKGYSSLVESFLRKKDQKCHLQNRLRLEIRVPQFMCREFLGAVPRSQCLVNGSFFEVFAQLCGRYPDVFPYLMEIGAGMFDPSVALLLSIGSHWHDSACENFCLVQQLLQSGADPNFEGCFVTPLQIAVYCLDFEAVNALLENGAHPNSTGCKEGVVWEEHTFMSQINHLHGASPLRIVRKYNHIDETPFWLEESRAIIEERTKGIEKARRKTEALLLQHGAQEISTSYTAALDEADHAQYAEERGEYINIWQPPTIH